MFLGIDLGTSGVKVVVISPDGVMLAQGLAPLSVSRPHELWSEQNPEDWWDATQAAVRAIDPALRRSVLGIGLAGQMHGATLLGTDDRPLRPAILWNDGRSFAECITLETQVPELRAITGNVAMPGFTAPKLLWVRRHEPEVFSQLRSVLLPKDYLRLRLTGDKASDMSDSAGTLWLDASRRTWNETMLSACGLALRHMPSLYEGSSITGRLRAEVAHRWDMAQVPVAAGGADNAAGAVGVGVVKDGEALLSLGTSGVIFVATNSLRPSPERGVHAFCHCLPALWHQMSVHLSAASSIDWVARLTATRDPAALFDLAETVGAAAGPEIFLPYLSGERTPHNDARIRGSFMALDHESGPAQLAQAVLEGVAFALADGLDALRDAGATITKLSVIGGGARSRYWGTIIAAALGTPLTYLQGSDVGPALGAAKLAQLAVTNAEIAAVCKSPPVAYVVEPEALLAERLMPKQARYRAAYQHLKQI